MTGLVTFPTIRRFHVEASIEHLGHIAKPCLTLAPVIHHSSPRASKLYCSRSGGVLFFERDHRDSPTQRPLGDPFLRSAETDILRSVISPRRRGILSARADVSFVRYASPTARPDLFFVRDAVINLRSANLVGRSLPISLSRVHSGDGRVEVWVRRALVIACSPDVIARRADCFGHSVHIIVGSDCVCRWFTRVISAHVIVVGQRAEFFGGSIQISVGAPTNWVVTPQKTRRSGASTDGASLSFARA